MDKEKRDGTRSPAEGAGGATSTSTAAASDDDGGGSTALAGVGYLLAGMSVFIVTNGSVQALRTNFVAQLAFRSVVGFVGSLVLFAIDGASRSNGESLSTIPSVAYWRGVLVWAMMLFYFASLQLLPFAVAVTLLLSAPGVTVIVSTALSLDNTPLRVSLPIFFVSFLGSVLLTKVADRAATPDRILHESASEYTVGVASGFGAMLLGAAYPIATSYVAKVGVDWRRAVFAQTAAGVVSSLVVFVALLAGAACIPPGSATREWAFAYLSRMASDVSRELPGLLGFSALAYVAMCVNVKGYSLISPGLGSLLQGFEIAASFLVQVFYFHSPCDAAQVAGAALILTSTSLVVLRARADAVAVAADASADDTNAAKDGELAAYGSTREAAGHQKRGSPGQWPRDLTKQRAPGSETVDCKNV